MSWGDSAKGGDSSSVQEQLRDVQQILDNRVGLGLRGLGLRA